MVSSLVGFPTAKPQAGNLLLLVSKRQRNSCVAVAPWPQCCPGVALFYSTSRKGATQPWPGAESGVSGKKTVELHGRNMQQKRLSLSSCKRVCDGAVFQHGNWEVQLAHEKQHVYFQCHKFTETTASFATEPHVLSLIHMSSGAKLAYLDDLVEPERTGICVKGPFTKQMARVLADSKQVNYGEFQSSVFTQAEGSKGGGCLTSP